MANWIKKNIFPLILFFVSGVLFFVNYKPGTFLIGWDNLFPEFNFKLNFTRDFFAVWQQYRGLGALDNFAQASNLLQDIYRLFLSLFLPNSLVRWVFVFITHFIGGLGIYYLICHLLLNKKKSVFIELTAFIGALFYQYNLGTIQQFFLPFEAFIIQFAFLPWLFLTAIKFVQDGRKKSLIILFLCSILATPQAFIPTLFAVYFSAIFIFFLGYVIIDKFRNIKRAAVLFAVILVTNIFWILPTGYSFLTHSKEVANAKNYQMASNDIFYRNKKYGDLSSIALIKGVVLDYKATDFKSNSTQYMMSPWLKHIDTSYFIVPAWVFFFLALIGFYKIIKNKNRELIPFAILFLFAFFMMGTDIPIINIPSNLLRQYIPLFATIFRFTFTKFSILYAFSYSIMLAIGIFYLTNIINKTVIKKIIYGGLILLIFVYTLPSFQGHFFYENLGVKIPDEYFQVFDFFNNQNHNERVAVLPIPWYWAWLQPKWGTINSGFIWYGIPQSITDLAFTPWGAQNENFYWEFDQAIFSKNPSLLEKVLEKYDISWIYLDKNILNEPGRKMTYEKYEQLLNNTNAIQLAAQFGSINIYHHQLKNNLNNFVEIKKNLPVVRPKYQYDSYDQAYVDYGDYYISDDSQVFYPFRSLFSAKDPKDIEYTVDEDEQFLYFKSQLPTKIKGWILQNSNSLMNEFTVFDKNLNINEYSPKISIVDNMLTVKIDKKLALLYQNISDQNYLNLTNDACQKNEKGTALMEKIENESYRFTSVGSDNCIKINLPNLSQRYGYLFNIQTTTDKKRGLHINLTNNTTDRADLETYADNDGNYHNYYLISSPRGFYDLGYSLYINNISEGREKVINTLEKINIYQIPYYFLKDLKMVKNLDQINTNDKKTIFTEVAQKNISFYQVKIDKVNGSSLLYLSQSFDPGWIAFANGKKLEHVLINNWANGWRLDTINLNKSQLISTNLNVFILFWPQYLEFVGFGLLILGFVIVMRFSPKAPQSVS